MGKVTPLKLEFKIGDDAKRPFRVEVLCRKSGVRIGEVLWFAPLRQYVFSPRISRVFTKAGLMEILNEMEAVIERDADKKRRCG